MKVELVPIATLKAYENNPKTHPQSQINLLKRSITEYGWTVPVLVDAHNVVIAGHGRCEAALQLGMTEVPVIRLEGLTEAQARAYRLADNKLTELGGWDPNLLAFEFEGLKGMSIDLDLTGFDMGEVGRVLAPSDASQDDAPTPPADPTTQPGDIWTLGRHRLICGDSTNAATVARLLDGAKPNLMITDPPYGVNYDPEWRVRVKSIGTVLNDDRRNWSEAFVLFPGDVVYAWHSVGAMQVDHYQALTAAGFQCRITIIWAKDKAPPGRGHYHVGHEPCFYAVRKGGKAHWIGDRTQTTLWKIHGLSGSDGAAREDKTPHSTQKPVECMARPMRNHAGDVYDPFLGSGTTLIAAEQLDRTCYGIELDPAYCDVIVERWQQYTGGTAVRT